MRNEVTTLDSFEIESDDFANNFFNEIESESDKKDKKILSLDLNTIQRKSTDAGITTSTEDPFSSISFSNEDFGFSSPSSLATTTPKVDTTTAEKVFISFTKPKSSTTTKKSIITTSTSIPTTTSSPFILELATSSLEDFSSAESDVFSTLQTEEPSTTTFIPSTLTSTTTTTVRTTTKLNCKLGSLDLRCPPTCHADSKDPRCPKPRTTRPISTTTPLTTRFTTSQLPTTIDDYISNNYNQLQALLEAQKSEILKSTTAKISKTLIPTITEGIQTTTPLSLETLVKANTKLFEIASIMKTTSTTTEQPTTEFVSLELLSSSEFDNNPSTKSTSVKTTTKKAPFSDAEDLQFLVRNKFKTKFNY